MNHEITLRISQYSKFVKKIDKSSQISFDFKLETVGN